MHKLDSGASTLYNGTVTLKAGVNELNAGANTLSQNSGALTNGAEQLKQGTVKIIDRMNDAEEKAEDFDKKLKTVKEAGDKYQSFAGISDGMTGEVKFIIKTDAVQDK
jgi:putative membrane protein